MSGPVAAIDCGTNTIKLLVGELPDVALRTSRMVRLGQGVDATGRLADEALERAFAAIDEYARLIDQLGVAGPERIRFCATSATRDASNASVFTEGVRARLGVEPEVLPGSEEAALSYAGAVRHLAAPHPAPVLVLDIGGGSTEMVLGRGDTPTAACSMDVGSVRLHERHLADDPPTAAQVAAVRADVDAALDAAREAGVDPAEAASVVAVAGTALTVGAGVLDLPSFDLDRLDQAVLATADVRRVAEEWVGLRVAARRGLAYMHPGRADVIGAGALVLERVLARCEAGGTTRLTLSRADILDGIAWSLVD